MRKKRGARGRRIELPCNHLRCRATPSPPPRRVHHSRRVVRPRRNVRRIRCVIRGVDDRWGDHDRPIVRTVIRPVRCAIIAADKAPPVIGWLARRYGEAGAADRYAPANIAASRCGRGKQCGSADQRSADGSGENPGAVHMHTSLRVAAAGFASQGTGAMVSRT